MCRHRDSHGGLVVSVLAAKGECPMERSGSLQVVSKAFYPLDQREPFKHSGVTHHRLADGRLRELVNRSALKFGRYAEIAGARGVVESAVVNTADLALDAVIASH